MDRDMSCCRVRKFFHVVSILLLRINSFRCNCCRWRGQEEVLAGEDVLQETLAREILKAEEHALARGNYGATVVARGGERRLRCNRVATVAAVLR